MGSESSGRVIGLDVGSKRIGVAVSDELGVLASPHGVIQRHSYNRDAAQIAALVDSLGAGRIVIGLPVGLAGRPTEQTERVRRFGQMLEARVSVPVDWWDERLTTVTAKMIERRNRATRAPRPRSSGADGSSPRSEAPPGRLDELAAAVLLQEYLDFRRRQ